MTQSLKTLLAAGEFIVAPESEEEFKRAGCELAGFPDVWNFEKRHVETK